LRKDIEDMTDRKAFVNVMEIKRPELDAYSRRRRSSLQLEKNVGFRRVMKKTMNVRWRRAHWNQGTYFGPAWGAQKSPRTEWMKKAGSRCKLTRRYRLWHGRKR